MKHNQRHSSDADSASVWHDFVFDFYEMHNKADMDSHVPLVNKLSSKRPFKKYSEKEQGKILEGRDIKSLTREEIGPIIDDAKTLSGPRKASKKQIDKIIETCEKLSLDLDEFLRDNGIEDLENLTGGETALRVY